VEPVPNLIANLAHSRGDEARDCAIAIAARFVPPLDKHPCKDRLRRSYLIGAISLGASRKHDTWDWSERKTASVRSQSL
jgi:hypothetical protein